MSKQYMNTPYMIKDIVDSHRLIIEVLCSNIDCTQPMCMTIFLLLSKIIFQNLKKVYFAY